MVHKIRENDVKGKCLREKIGLETLKERGGVMQKVSFLFSCKNVRKKLSEEEKSFRKPLIKRRFNISFFVVGKRDFQGEKEQKQKNDKY